MLVATLILAFGLIGLAGLQATSLRASSSALQRSQVNLLGQDIVDRMRANRASAINSQTYETSSDSDLDDDADFTTDPSGNATAIADVAAWRVLLADFLPSGQGAIVCDGSICHVRIRWDDTRSGGATWQIYDMSTQL